MVWVREGGSLRAVLPFALNIPVMLKKSQVLNEGMMAALAESYELIYEHLIDIECEAMLEMLNESETQHWDEQRKLKALALWKILGDGQDYLKVYIDKGHQNGAEIHRCLTNGCVIVYNQRTGKIVTAMAKTP